MTLLHPPKLYMKLRVCRRCGELYKDAGKCSKICPKCCIPFGGRKKDEINKTENKKRT